MPPRKSRGDIFIAKESFSCEVAGEMVSVAKGDRVREGHELLSLRPDAFENVADAPLRFEVEDASASPGTRRG